MTHIRRSWFCVPLVVITAVLLCCAALPVWAQTTSMGTMTGVVTDQSNAVLPGATVTITDKSTGTTQTTVTNTAGRYVFVNLRSGTYDVTVTKTGFSKVTIPGDVIEVGDGLDEQRDHEGRQRVADCGSAGLRRRVADPERHRRQYRQRSRTGIAPHSCA